MHTIQFLGLDNRVSKELSVETKKSKDGKDYKVATFSIAAGNGAYKDASGNWQQRDASFFVIKTQVPYLVEKLEKKCKKGALVNLTGTPVPWSVKKDDGTYASGFYVLVEKGDVLEIFDVVKSEKTTTSTEAETPTDSTPIDYNNVDISNEDLPFDI